jgi:hypothetical protein
MQVASSNLNLTESKTKAVHFEKKNSEKIPNIENNMKNK